MTEFTCANCHVTIGDAEPWSIKDGKAVHRECPAHRSKAKPSKAEAAEPTQPAE